MKRTLEDVGFKVEDIYMTREEVERLIEEARRKITKLEKVRTSARRPSCILGIAKTYASRLLEELILQNLCIIVLTSNSHIKKVSKSWKSTKHGRAQEGAVSGHAWAWGR